MDKPQPLILTLQIDHSSFEYFNSLRKKYFPAKINYLDAHLTLFHHLPDLPNISEELAKISLTQQFMNLEVVGLIKLGGGVAFKINNEKLQKLHLELQKKWDSLLTAQDKQKLRPHITIQNKVKSEQALILYEELNPTFKPFNVNGTGLSLWRYLGGPWSKIKDYNFKGL